MRIISPRLERRAIRTLASSNTKIASTALAMVDENDFHFPPALEMYKRISFLAKRRGRTVEWEELINDPAINESVRKQFSSYTKGPWKSIDSVKANIEQLHKYRRLRQWYSLSESIVRKIEAEKIDLDALADDVSNKITEIRTGNSILNAFTNIGGDNREWLKVLDDILSPKESPYIPTGFNAFDSKNGGIFRGSLMLIAASTGGGKSTLAQILAINMAKFGARVAMVSLEMERDEMIRRMMANLSGVSMSKFIKPELMDESEKRIIKKKARKFHKIIKRVDALYSVISPEEDVTMEEVLFTTKPFDYDVIIIDYINLLKGMDEAEQWRKLGAAARFAKRYASINKCIVILLAQLSEEGIVRYSRAMVEHASNAWTWVYGQEARDSRIIDVRQLKARNQSAFPFQLKEQFDLMRITDFEGGKEYDKTRTKQVESKTKSKYNNKETQNSGIKTGEDYYEI